MRARLFLVVVPAAGLAAADLTLKATMATAPWDFHQRSHGWVALSAALLLGAVALARVPSHAVAIAAGVMSGGVVGNLVSAVWTSNRVPNPIVIGDRVNGLAFNLADVLILLGIVLLMVSLIRVAIRNRHRLIEPRGWERALRRRFGSS